MCYAEKTYDAESSRHSAIKFSICQLFAQYIRATQGSQ
jgi:hypothetical protein